jgi:polysaccharide biosynthesis protein PslH
VKILFIVPYVPNKIRIRPYSLVRFLASRGNQVTLLTLWSDEMDHEAIRQLKSDGVEVYAFPLPAWRSLLNSLFGGLFSREPVQSFYCWQPQLAAKMEDLLFGNKVTDPPFDVVHIEHLRGARYGQFLFDREKKAGAKGKQLPPIIWDSVDCISYLFEQASRSSQKITSRLITRLELDRTRRYEARMAQLFQRTLVTSSLDQEAFSSLTSPGTDLVTILPNGVDLDYFSPTRWEDRDPATLVVSGKMSYHANVSMVMNLMENIMPHVWAKRPDVKVQIVGKDPPQSVRKLEDQDKVTVTGYVADLRPYLQKATIALAPLTYGAGIQNKVLEAMACATPVVATHRATAALSVTSGQDLIVEENPVSFANQVLYLLDNPQHARRIGECGRKFVEMNHSWSAITGQLEAVYSKAADRNSS